MSRAYLLTGGNLGNRAENLAIAYSSIEKRCGKITCASSIYETAAWGVTDQPSFYNQVLEVQTALSPEELMNTLLAIEAQMGRKRIQKMGPRSIDLDILFIDALVMESAFLTVPHPAIAYRRFVLMPLSEIAPGLVHPVLHKTVGQLLRECTDTLDVQKKTG